MKEYGTWFLNGRASIEGREGGCEMKVLEDGCEERACQGWL